jgi:glycosyltransferase involved in cell wall biosynthesis
MLVFDSIESGRFPFGWTKARYRILRHQQLRSLKTSAGNIFLSNYAKESIQRFIPKTNKPTRVIHHGVDQRFLSNPKNTLSPKKHLKLLYVSTVNFYKHQWNVVDAVDKLRGTGIDLSLKLIGGGHPDAIKRLYKFIAGKTDFVEYCGSVEYETLHEEYKKADLFIFASTCENMPNILLEAMAAGKPIACSNYPPMPEFLKNCGIYFDPLNKSSICQAISELAQNPELASNLSSKAYQEAEKYTWKKTADETFDFLQTCVEN